LNKSYIKLLLIVLFATVFTIGCAIIIFIQAVHGTSTSFGEVGLLQSSDRTSTLIVMKNVTYPPINETELTTIELRSFFTANDFIIHVNGNNPSPFDFPGSESGTSVSIGSRPYAVTETKPPIPSLLPLLFLQIILKIVLEY
jgi:hypothetical protein